MLNIAVILQFRDSTHTRFALPPCVATGWRMEINSPVGEAGADLQISHGF
jgi:hypothetical protein